MSFSNVITLCALALCTLQRPAAADTLEPCAAPPDEYYAALDSRIDTGRVGRIVASVTAVPFQASEWGVRVLDREGAYVVRVSDFDGSLFYSLYGDKVPVPVRAAEFSLERGLAQRIVAAVGREIAKAQSSEFIALPDNPIFRFSTNGITCGRVTWQSTESVASQLVQVFSELRCIPDLPPRKHRAVYKKLEGILNEIEAVASSGQEVS